MTRFDVAVVGAGPAGIAAAVVAAEHGSRVVLVDESPDPGGQIWRRELGTVPRPARSWIERLRRADIRIISGTSVWWAQGRHRHLQTTSGSLEASRTILCCGAREVFLPFPGWDTPGVVGLGGLQALAAGGLDLDQRRVVLAGSGPLLLQVARKLERYGARIERIAEQTPFGNLLRFVRKLDGRRALQAIPLLHHRLRCSSWPVEALGDSRIRGVRLSVAGQSHLIDCDYLGVGFGLEPNLELPRALGCDIESDRVVVDGSQQTSVAGVFAAGELCGIKGAPGAVAEGVCAGYRATDQAIPARWRRRRDRARTFADVLSETFSLRQELRHLGQEDTVLCRCEGVSVGQIASYENWPAAKTHTRCGMGLCQGRVCSTAARHLFDWQAISSRPPLVPVPIRQLMSSPSAGGDRRNQ